MGAKTKKKSDETLSPKELRKHVKLLRKYCPVSKPVKILRKRNLRRVSIETPTGTSKEPVLGYCYKAKKNYVIVISLDQTAAEQVETLRHEWAHLMAEPAQRALNSEFSHDHIWGWAYANVWREHVEGETESLQQYLERIKDEK